MLSGVCSSSNHKHHQIQFITNIEDHNKTLRKYRETVMNNHKHNESISKFISNDCIQLYCWPPQSSAQPVFPSRGDFPLQQGNLSQIEWLSLRVWLILNVDVYNLLTIFHTLHPRITLSSERLWWLVLRGYRRYFKMYEDMYHNAVQFNRCDDALSKRNHNKWNAAQ